MERTSVLDGFAVRPPLTTALSKARPQYDAYLPVSVLSKYYRLITQIIRLSVIFQFNAIVYTIIFTFHPYFWRNVCGGTIEAYYF